MYNFLITVDIFHLPEIINHLGVICAERKTNIDYVSVFAKLLALNAIWKRPLLSSTGLKCSKLLQHTQLVFNFEMKEWLIERRKTISLYFNLKEVLFWINLLCVLFFAIEQIVLCLSVRKQILYNIFIFIIWVCQRSKIYLLKLTG